MTATRRAPAIAQEIVAENAARLHAEARAAANFLKALAHDGRLLILRVIADGERSVGELGRLTGMRQPAVSQQLARLRADDLVATRRDGRSVYYSIVRPELRDIIVALHKTLRAPAP